MGWLSCDFPIVYIRSEFWDIIGQSDEKGHLDAQYFRVPLDIKHFYSLFLAQLELEL